MIQSSHFTLIPEEEEQGAIAETSKIAGAYPKFVSEFCSIVDLDVRDKDESFVRDRYRQCRPIIPKDRYTCSSDAQSVRFDKIRKGLGVAALAARDALATLPKLIARTVGKPSG